MTKVRIDPKKERFAKWYVLPKEAREPRTQKELAAELEVSEWTIVEWGKKLERIKEATTENTYDWFMDTLKDLMFTPKGTSNDRKLFAEINGWKIDRQEIDAKVDFTTSEKIKVGAEFRDVLHAEFRDTGVCPICHQCKTLHDQPRLDKGREQ